MCAKNYHNHPGSRGAEGTYIAQCAQNPFAQFRENSFAHVLLSEQFQNGVRNNRYESRVPMYRTGGLQVSEDSPDRGRGDCMAVHEEVLPCSGTHESGAV